MRGNSLGSWIRSFGISVMGVRVLGNEWFDKCDHLDVAARAAVVEELDSARSYRG